MVKAQTKLMQKDTAHSAPADKESGALSLPGHLQKVFGFSAFRLNQEAIVREIMRGRDVFAVMPTGGGKSLCYQRHGHDDECKLQRRFNRRGRNTITV